VGGPRQARGPGARGRRGKWRRRLGAALGGLAVVQASARARVARKRTVAGAGERLERRLATARGRAVGAARRTGGNGRAAGAGSQAREARTSGPAQWLASGGGSARRRRRRRRGLAVVRRAGEPERQRPGVRAAQSGGLRSERRQALETGAVQA
jgi:hypothetical protein